MGKIPDITHVHDYWVDIENREVWIHGIDRHAESDYDEEPGVEYMMANRVIKNLHLLRKASPTKPILVHLHTCFDGMTKVETKSGHVRIKDISIGDEVLTHKNRYRKVTDVMSRDYHGKMIRLGCGRRGNAQKISATPNHPILVERNGKKEWIPFEEVALGDVVFVLSKECEKTGELIPYYKKQKPKQKNREFKRSSKSGQEKHLKEDIIPFCEEKKAEGWVMVPVGGNVIPDAIGFKDNKVVAFEIENTDNRDYNRFKFKKTKYEGHIINDYVDDVIWEVKGKDPEKDIVYSDTWYEVDEESGFCKVRVLSKEEYVPKNLRRKVYNLTVDEDNSYLASKVVVHNCGGIWEEGMSIYDTIKMMSCHVTMVSYTHARSMSSLILQAADERLMLPNSCFMFHWGTLDVGGHAPTVYSNVDFTKKNDDIMLDIYVEKCLGSPKFGKASRARIREELKRMMNTKGDVYLTSKEAVEWGLADGIIEDWKTLYNAG